MFVGCVNTACSWCMEEACGTEGGGTGKTKICTVN